MASSTRTKKTRHKVASVPPPTGLAEELVDQLVAFRPIEITTVETSMGVSEATTCQVVTVDADGVPHNRGTIPIFWVVIRDQLRHATPEIPWIAGVFLQVGRAYRLRELAPDESSRVAAALDQLSD